jgi:hypothetical protein
MARLTAGLPIAFASGLLFSIRIRRRGFAAIFAVESKPLTQQCHYEHEQLDRSFQCRRQILFLIELYLRIFNCLGNVDAA